MTTKELHGKGHIISRFDNDNFKLDFNKNQAICPAGHRMGFARKAIDKRTRNWTNIYRTKKCKDCKFRKECISTKNKSYREARINPLMRKIRLRFKTKKGIKNTIKDFIKEK